MKDEFIKSLQSMLSEYSFSSRNIPDGIKYLLEHELWREREPAPGALSKRTFKTFSEFCEFGTPFGLNTRCDVVKALCKDRIDVLDLIDRANKGIQGERTDLKDGNFVDNINEVARPTGTSKEAGLRTLRKNRPDLHKKVTSNEMSVNAAMIEAGFRKKKIQIVIDDIEKIAQALIKNLSEDERRILIQML